MPNPLFFVQYPGFRGRALVGSTVLTQQLDVFTSANQGAVPASGGGTSNFLRADGTWAAPSGGGGGVSDGDKGDVVVSSSGTVWSLDYTAVNAAIAPTWGNITSKPADLTTIAGLSPSNDDFLQRKAGAWANRTVAQVKSDLGLTGTNSGDQTITLTGDVTGSGTGSFAATLATVNSNTGSFGSATQVAQITLDGKGRATAAANVTITPDWSNITSKPAAVTALSGTNTGDQTSIVGITGTIAQFNTAVTDANLAVTTAANSFTGVQTFGQEVILTGLTSDPSSPADGTAWYDSRINTVKAVIGGRSKDVFADLFNSGTMSSKAIVQATTFTNAGWAAPTAVGTATAASIATTNKHTMYPRVEALVTTPATTAVAGWRTAANPVTLGGASANLGGFRLSIVWGPATGVATSTNRGFCGLKAGYTPTDVQPSSLVSGVWMGWDAADTNIQMMHNDAAETATKIDLGSNFAVPTADRTSVYKLELYSPKGTTQSVQYRVTDMVNGYVAQGTLNTDLPATSVLLSPHVWMSAGGTSSVIGVALMSMYLDPLL